MLNIENIGQVQQLIDTVCQHTPSFRLLVTNTLGTALNIGIPVGVTHGGEHFLQKTCPRDYCPNDIDLTVPKSDLLGEVEGLFLRFAERSKLRIASDGLVPLPDGTFARAMLTRTPCRPNGQRLLIECGNEPPDPATSKMHQIAKVDVLLEEPTEMPTFDTLRGAMAKSGLYHQPLSDDSKESLATTVDPDFWVNAYSYGMLTAEYLTKLFSDLRAQNSPPEVYQILAETSFFNLFPTDFFLRANIVVFNFLTSHDTTNTQELLNFFAEVHYTVQLSALQAGKYQQSL